MHHKTDPRSNIDNAIKEETPVAVKNNIETKNAVITHLGISNFIPPIISNNIQCVVI